MRTLYPSVLGIACCAFVLNCSVPSRAQEVQRDPEQMVNTVALAELPDSPSATLSQLQESSGQTENSQSQNTQPPQSAAPAQRQEEQRPVGTAAAEAPKVSGITAAQPAGVAIAPGKQRRVRTIVLKVGAIVGAGAALGTVIALTAGTPSKPPGAH
jgi:septal ring-binding cell division protein DamX